MAIIAAPDTRLACVDPKRLVKEMICEAVIRYVRA